MPPFSAQKALMGAGDKIRLLNFTGTVVEHSAVDPSFGVMTDDGSIFVMGGGSDGTDLHILTSTDGETWTHRASGVTNSSSGIAYNGTRFVISNLVSSVTEATDPTGTWTLRTVASSHFNNAIMWDEPTGLFIIVGNTFSPALGRIHTSPDGITWTERTPSGSSNNMTSVHRSSNNTLVAFGRTSGFIPVFSTSTNGTSWTNLVTFDSGANSFTASSVFDPFNDRHYILTDTEVGYIPNNSGPPQTTGFVEIGVNEGGFGTLLQVQGDLGGPLIWSVDDKAKWTNDFTTVDSVTLTNITATITAGLSSIHYGFDGNYYVCGYKPTPQTGYIERLT